MKPSTSVLGLLLFGLVWGCTAPTTFVIVRHAEKEKGPDPGLTPAGERRAAALRDAVAEADVRALYHTPYRRTRLTLEPTAEHFGLEPIEIAYEVGKEAEHAAAFVAAARKSHAGGTVIYSGHTTTVPALLRELGFIDAPEIPETDYSNLFIIVSGDVPKIFQVKFDPR